MLELLKRQLDGIMATRLRSRAVGFGHPGMVSLKDLMEHALQGGASLRSGAIQKMAIHPTTDMFHVAVRSLQCLSQNHLVFG